MWETLSLRSSTEERPQGNGLLPDEDIGHTIKLPLFNVGRKDIILGRGGLAFPQPIRVKIALKQEPNLLGVYLSLALSRSPS
jgi:hypothetical protein